MKVQLKDRVENLTVSHSTADDEVSTGVSSNGKMNPSVFYGGARLKCKAFAIIVVLINL